MYNGNSSIHSNTGKLHKAEAYVHSKIEECHQNIYLFLLTSVVLHQFSLAGGIFLAISQGATYKLTFFTKSNGNEYLI